MLERTENRRAVDGRGAEVTPPRPVRIVKMVVMNIALARAVVSADAVRLRWASGSPGAALGGPFLRWGVWFG